MTSSSDTAASRQPGLFAKLPYQLLLSAVVLAQLAACQTKVDAEPVAAQKAEPVMAPVVPAPSQDSVAERATAKLHAYRACQDTIGAQARLSIERYSTWAKGVLARVTGKEMIVHELLPLNSGNVAKCRSSFEEASAGSLAPDSVDAAALRYASAIVAFEKALGDAYVRHGGKRTKTAKNRPLPPALAAGTKAFEVASAAFSDALGRENDKSVRIGQARLG